MSDLTRPIASDCFRRRGGLVFSCFAGARTASILVLMALVAFSAGCNPERRYKVLSFFFDGVPDPNAPVAQQDAEGNPVAPGAPGAGPVAAIMHKPFADNQCAACHGDNSGRFEDFQKVEATICAKCHANVPTQYPVMHGPVAVGECTLCHTPHESTVPHLLKEAPPAVCTQCHVPDLLPAQPVDHVTATRNCLDCHTGHGGTKHGMLRADYTPAAASQPATAPASPASPASARADEALQRYLARTDGGGG